jgi:hypothetical protein
MALPVTTIDRGSGSAGYQPGADRPYLLAILVDSSGDEVVLTGAGAGAATEATLATLLTEATWTTRLGEVQAIPTTNTLLGRLAAMEAGLGLILADLQAKADLGETQPVSAASLPLPSGASTAANQATGNTALAAIQAAVEILDNIVAGSEAQVDVVSMPTDTTVSGDITAISQSVSVAIPSGASSVGMQVTGTWVGQLEFEATVDGANYNPVEASNGVASVNATSGNDIFILPAAGYDIVRVRSSAWTSGTATVTLIASIGAAGTIQTGAIPAGDNNIGNVDLVTLPAGNLGQQAAAASLSTAPATDIADATYIGDIKFGEALPTGSNAIGRLAANSGVDIGDVDVTSTPETEAVSDTATVAFGSIPAAYDGTGLTLSNVTTGYILCIDWTGDTAVKLSLDDGTTDHIHVPPHSSRTLDLKSNQLKLTDTIEVEYVTAPALGTLYLSLVGV